MDSSDEEVLIGAALAVLATVRGRKKDLRRGRAWTGPITNSRRHRGAYHTTVPRLLLDADCQLPANRVGTFRNYFRVSRDQFDVLLNKVSPLITKSPTNSRDSICPEERLMVTLRYLATGSSFTQLHYDWCLSVSIISGIIPETCAAIYSCLREEYLKTPDTEERWQAISKSLADNWNFPNAIGALDGKHIVMRKPWNAGSQFHNYKGQESIILLAMCDANYSFTYIDVGANGRASDGGVFSASSLKAALEEGILNLPSPQCPPNSDQQMPFVIVGDEAFPLKHYLMRPYPRRALDHQRRIFNYRLSRVRRLIENAFGILTATWRVLLGHLTVEPEKAKVITLACCALHNFIRKSRPMPQGAGSEVLVQPDDVAPLPGLTPQSAHPSHAAQEARELFCAYFNSVGSIPWQDDKVQ